MNQSLNVIDLFCGAGGLSIGFEQAGLDVIAGVDVNERFIKSYRESHPTAVGICADITSLSAEDILDHVDTDRVDGVIGGPPCQGFSIAGRRNPDDERNNLVLHFIRLVGELDPDFFLMENVSGIKSMKTPDGELVTDKIRQAVPSSYTTRDAILNSVHYGTPQKRKRYFLAGVKHSGSIRLPNQTHGPGNGLFSGDAVTVDDALSDLPPPTVDEPQQYENDPRTEFQQYLRQGNSELHNHVPTNHRTSTIEKMSKQAQGESLYDSYSDSWYRLVPNEPAPTVKENHNAPFVHPHKDRVTTPRECARLQGFPDRVRFLGPKSDQLVQIGNAVPPQFGRAWGEAFLEMMGSANEERSKVATG